MRQIKVGKGKRQMDALLGRVIESVPSLHWGIWDQVDSTSHCKEKKSTVLQEAALGRTSATIANLVNLNVQVGHIIYLHVELAIIVDGP